jgi:hypothetical protein
MRKETARDSNWHSSKTGENNCKEIIPKDKGCRKEESQWLGVKKESKGLTTTKRCNWQDKGNEES